MRKRIKSPFGTITLLDEQDEKNFRTGGAKNIISKPKRTLAYRQELNDFFLKHNPDFKIVEKGPAKTLPASFSWREKGKVTPVKNQNPYGTCWAFANVAALEASYLIRHHETVSLSEQDLINCNCRPCNGSDNTPFASTGDKLMKTGITSEAFLPYRGDGNISPCDPEKVKENCGKCNTTAIMPYRIEAYDDIDPNDDDTIPASASVIKQAVFDHGPIVVKMHIPDGSAFFSFTGTGTFKETIPLVYEPKRNNDAHIIIITGWDDKRKAWQIKNSWGTKFGDGGFCWIAYGSDNIGMSATWLRAETPEFRVTAVWHQSNEDEMQVYGWSYINYRKYYDYLWKEGWRLHLLETAVVNNEVEYSAVWRKAEGLGELQLYDAAYKNFKAEYDKLWKEGWRLHLLSNYVLNAQVYYTAVWRQAGNIGETQYYSLEFDDFKSKNEALTKEGWRLRILNNYVLNEKVLYTAVWRQEGNIAQAEIFGWKYADYRAKYDTLWKDGWRLYILSNYVVNGTVLYTAVWRKPGATPELQVYSYEYEYYRAADAEYRAKGYRLSLVNTYAIN